MMNGQSPQQETSAANGNGTAEQVQGQQGNARPKLPGEGGKYVPPAFRNNNSNSSGRGGGGRGRGRGRGGGGGGGRGGGRDLGAAFGNNSDRGADTNFNNSNGNSYTNSFARGGGGGGSGGGGRFSNMNGGGGGGNGGGGRGPRGYMNNNKNALGFHGDLRSSGIMENRLFGEVKNTGINFDKYDEIPVETSGRDCPPGVETFDEMDLPASLRDNLGRTNFAKPTPVQKFAMPIGTMGRDMMACAQTGSGKTGGFLFPVITMLLKTGPSPPPEMYENRSRPPAFPHALILAPTRELASQINDEAEKFSYCTGLAPVVIYGGAEARNQIREIERGCDILTATPGRLVDMIERGRISLACVKFLVLDEADRMLDMGFEPQIRRIVEQEDMPWGEDRRTFMFSATFPKEIQRLASDFLRDYVFLTVGRVGSAAKDITQKIEWCDHRDKTSFLIHFLNTVESGLVLVFVETKKAADMLEFDLQREGYPTTSIHGDRTQDEREEALAMFKEGRAPILVATDVASRGLDIDNVMYVVNYDMPNNIDDYVHRIGRTGRAGNNGYAISLFTDKNMNMARDLAELLDENGQEVPQWLMATRGGGGRGGGGGGGRGGGSRGGKRGSKYGARDFRKSGGDGPPGQGSRSSFGGNSSSYGGGRQQQQFSQPRNRDAW